MVCDPFSLAVLDDQALTSDASLIALCGPRNGYLQLAPALCITTYAALPDAMVLAAKDWAVRLEALGARRVYWITLSEVVRRLHIHLYPRWSDEEPRGLALFEQREQPPQPEWTAPVRAALADWRVCWGVALPAEATG